MLRRLFLLMAIVVAVAVVTIPPLRDAVLRRAGQTLVAGADQAAQDEAARGFSRTHPADLLAMDVESGAAGVLKLSDLYHAQGAGTVGLLRQTETSVDSELAQRGVLLPNLALDALAQLGVPKRAIIEIPAGEGGTTESTEALAGWVRANPGKRVLVVVGASHGRRYGRALRRAWPKDQPSPVVVTTPYGLFHADSWWMSRTTLREGLVEIEKLALDYAAHPF
jgi:hypothetical protein